MTSERLNYRRLAFNDAEFLIELLNSKGWLDNIGDRGVRTIEQAEAYLRDRIYPVCDKPWSGPYLIHVRETNEPIGTIGVYLRPGLDIPDLGFALLPQYFRKGYASEAAQWAIELAKTNKLPGLSAIALPSNEASVSLLLKLGFDPKHMVTLPDDDDELQYFELAL
ncbi:MAG: GNAT family N-acetyltransferase [Saprospiraceae bacterium]